ncbi:uncharacterized protein [Chaetodon trifascialis]|uniref:uncharacterized protein n=1 Tax=Chaetodon trifascialis TaxID=109706 RepID=UPI0039968DD6
MSSQRVPAVETRLHQLSTRFDPETAAVVTILLGLFQVLLSVLLAYADETLPKLFILPLVSGILIVAGGSFTMASKRNPSKLLLRGCACSNMVGLLGAMLAFFLYCYSLSIARNELCVPIPHDYDGYRRSYYGCPGEALAAYCWSVTLLLLLYDSGAVVLHCLLSISAFKALKTE